MKKKLRNIILHIIYSLFKIFPIKKNKIAIVSFYGKGYGDSAKYICNEIFKRNLHYDIVWLVKNMQSEMPIGIRKVKYNSLRAMYELATAKIWIDNSRKPIFLSKRKNQFYLQTWHSNLRLKKIEQDAEKYLDKNYIKAAKHDSKMANAVIVGCDFSYNTMKNSFWYDGPIYKTGIPRCDELFNNEKNIIDGIKRKLQIENINNIILYAPTFRNNKNIDLSNIDVLIHELEKKYNDDFVILVRFHPVSNQKIELREKIINVTNFPDIQELIKVSDVLVTDYSGCMFDAAIAHKKCVIYAPDYDDYIKNQREIYFNFDELPFYKANTFMELSKLIINFDEKDYAKRINKFLNYINCYEEGNSSKKVVDLLERVMKNEKI